MTMDDELKEKIQRLQTIEENLHSYLAQKQQLQAQLMEHESAKAALPEKGKAFSIIGNVMIERPADEIATELDGKMERAKQRIESLEKQEGKQKTQAESLQKEIMQKMQKE